MRRVSLAPRVWPLLAATASLPFAAAVFAACSDAGPARPCTDIPAGGCPVVRGVSCQDPACEAVYACLPSNRWELRERCPLRAPGPDGSPAGDAGAEGPAFDAAVDAPPGAFGGPGCVQLSAPDCSLGLALACGQGCCDCEDLFVCENGGWELWGACTAQGLVPAE